MSAPITNAEIRRVSNTIDDLVARLTPGIHGGRFLTAGDIEGLIDELRALRSHARALENEISALRWNEAGRRDMEDLVARRLRNAVSQNSGNVVLFPVVARRTAENLRLFDNQDGLQDHGEDGA